MNRSILIVICDFLLISLLAFSTVDANKLAHPGTMSKMQMNFAQTNNNNEAGAKQDLGEAMRMALAEEQKNRAVLVGELAQTRAAASNQQLQLTAREQQLQTFQQQMQLREEQAHALQQQVVAAETNMQSLNARLQQTAAESTLSQQQRDQMAEEARKQAEKASALQKQLEALQQANEQALAQNHDLANQLQSSESARTAANAQLLTMRDEVTAQRAENTKLAEGVTALAGKSAALAQEIHDNTPLTPNMIFNDAVSNRVEAEFAGVRAGVFGDASKAKEASTILTTDGTNVFGVCHVQDTPIVLGAPGANWEDLNCTLTHDAATATVNSLTFSATDPRILLMPIQGDVARKLGTKVFKLSSDPYKFQDAVVVGLREGYYGEVKFDIDLTTPDYFKMDHSSLRGLFGKFNPASGDLVFSRNGELLGVMANNTYCVQLHNASALAGFELGPQIRNQGTSQTISTLYTMVAGLPYKLQ